jgi:hypothetical protein
MPQMAMATYTLIDGVPHVTEFSQGGSGSSISFEPVSVKLGSHPVAKELASLGLPDAPVVLTTWTEKMKGSFGAAVPL